MADDHAPIHHPPRGYVGDSEDLIGKADTSISTQQLCAMAVSVAYDAAQVIAGKTLHEIDGTMSIRHRRTIKLAQQPGFDYAPFVEVAEKIKKNLGQYYFKRGHWDFEQLHEALESLRDVPLVKSYSATDFMKAEDLAPADVTFEGTTEYFPYRSLLDSMDYQPEAWRKMIAERKVSGHGHAAG